MKYPKCEKYDEKLIKEKIMGPNPIKLLEELMLDNLIPEGATVMDLGSGEGLTSVFLAREYGFKVYAADLWSDPENVAKFFAEMGVSPEAAIPVHADANDLPFEHDFFDAVVSTDSYNYFGLDPDYLGAKLLPFVKKGGYIYVTVPGMKKDLHDNLPPELLLSWTPEQLDFLHDTTRWESIISKAEGAEIISLCEMESNEEVWADWIACENDYAVSDRKSINAGAGRYLNFIKIVIRKK